MKTTQSQTSHVVFLENTSKKKVHFEEIIVPVTTTVSSTSLSLPLLAEKTGVRFQLSILFLALSFALLLGIILSILLVSQLFYGSIRPILPRRYVSDVNEEKLIQKNLKLFGHLPSSLITQIDLSRDVCEDFYQFVCQKWLITHPILSSNIKRTWLTERSRDIRSKFAEKLLHLSQIELTTIDQNETIEIDWDIEDPSSSTPMNNELEQFYSFHPDYDEESRHQLIKRQVNSPVPNLSQSISNMLLYYHQCHQTSSVVLNEQLQILIDHHFWFTHLNEEQSIPSDPIFSQMLNHPLMQIWNMNPINLGTQMIIHIQRQIQDQEKLFTEQQYQIEQAILFEEYLHRHDIDLCYSSTRVGSLENTLKQYNQLLITSLSESNLSISDDLEQLLSNENSLPIIHSSIRRPTDLHHLIQFIIDRNILQVLNDSEIEHLFLNFTRDLQQYLLHVPIFRSTISHQCQLFLQYYIRFRSLNDTSHLHAWFDYIASSIIHLIVHSWPGDASYTCLYTTIVRHQQLELISYWKTFLRYARNEIKEQPSPIISVEIRLVDFFQLDSIFRFLFADQYAHYCHLMVYKYAPKLLTFISVFDKEIQENLNLIWKQQFEELMNKNLNVPSPRIPVDCLSLLELYYPYTLASFYEHMMINQTEQLYSIAFELRDLLIRQDDNQSNNSSLTSLEIHIKPERLKLYEDLSSQSIPYEFYPMEETYFLTAWNVIEKSRESFVQVTHEFFDLNAHHTIKDGIFLQPTIAELYQNDSTQLAALLLIAHELGHASCPCGSNRTEREYFADLLALNLVIDYHEEQYNRTMTADELSGFFLHYGQSECMHINHEMRSLLHRDDHQIDNHVNRLIRTNEQFQQRFNCSTDQQERSKETRRFLPHLCRSCRMIK